MSSFERIAVLIVGVGMVTTLVLPNRQTVGVINASGNLFARALGTAMGTARPA